MVEVEVSLTILKTEDILQPPPTDRSEYRVRPGLKTL
jgi:hypothetical protein